MSESRYVVRPRADGDLDDQAYYYATIASADVGHRFLVAAHDTFSLLATQPDSCAAGIRLRQNVIDAMWTASGSYAKRRPTLT